MNALSEKLVSETNDRQEGDSALQEAMKAYLPISWDQASMTLLLKNQQGEGNLKLNQSYRNFDAILFITAADSYDEYFPSFWPVWLFDWMMNFAKTRGKRPHIGPRYSWTLDPTKSTDTLLATYNESSAVIVIYGINFAK